MPIAGQRDPEATRLTLVEWLGQKMPEARDLAVPELEIPQSSGFSNETFLFDATWTDAEGAHQEEFVLRAQPQEYGLFPDIDVIAQQYRTMKLVYEHTDIPVARVRWPEPDPDVLGQPFFVMDRVHGEVPADTPPHTLTGFVMDLSPEGRRELHQSGLETMTRIHQVDWRKVGFEHLDRPKHGRPGGEQLRGFFRYFYEWALEGRPHPVVDAAWQWLVERWPNDDEHLDLTWGDARIGNLMFRDRRVVAVFDWEMAAIANAESDLGWWIFMQRFHTEGMGTPIPPGFLDRAETIAFWEERVGRPATHVDFYEVLGGFHFSLIMVMLGKNMARLAPGGFDESFGLNNPGPQVLAKILGL